jgi:ABC-type transport system involved in multi-copper enzyme maturation permease subunit
VSAANRMRPGEFLAGVGVIAARELGATFDSSIAYVYAIAFTVLSNSIFMNEFFLAGTLDMRAWFELMPLLLAFFLPAVTMRLWAEERKQRTIELLLTLPVVPLQATLGKYLASLGLFGFFLLGSLPIVIMLVALGEPDLGLIASGYLGLICLGALFLAFGAFLSSLSSDQITAFVTSTLLGFAFVLTGNDRVVAVLDGLFPQLSLGTRLYESFSVMPHYDAFVAGSISLAAVTYFVLLAALFLWVNALVLERSRS